MTTRYTATITATPMRIARGNVRCGSRTSPPTHVACCQPPKLNRVGTRAASRPGAPTSGAADSGLGAAGAMTAKAATPRSAASLPTTVRFWIRAPQRTPTALVAPSATTSSVAASAADVGGRPCPTAAIAMCCPHTNAITAIAPAWIAVALQTTYTNATPGP